MFRRNTGSTISPPPPPPPPPPGDDPAKVEDNVLGDIGLQLKVKVLENQRLDFVTNRWSFKNLTVTDPKRFSSDIGETDQFPTVPLQEGWMYSGLWEMDISYPTAMYSMMLAMLVEEEEGVHPDTMSSAGGSGAATVGNNSTASTGTVRPPSASRAPMFLSFSPSGEVLADNVDPDGPNEWVYGVSFEAIAQGSIIPPHQHPASAGAAVRQRRYHRCIDRDPNYKSNSSSNSVTSTSVLSMPQPGPGGEVGGQQQIQQQQQQQQTGVLESEAAAAGAVRKGSLVNNFTGGAKHMARLMLQKSRVFRSADTATSSTTTNAATVRADGSPQPPTRVDDDDDDDDNDRGGGGGGRGLSAPSAATAVIESRTETLEYVRQQSSSSAMTNHHQEGEEEEIAAASKLQQLQAKQNAAALALAREDLQLKVAAEQAQDAAVQAYKRRNDMDGDGGDGSSNSDAGVSVNEMDIECDSEFGDINEAMSDNGDIYSDTASVVSYTPAASGGGAMSAFTATATSTSTSTSVSSNSKTAAAAATSAGTTTAGIPSSQRRNTFFPSMFGGSKLNSSSSDAGDSVAQPSIGEPIFSSISDPIFKVQSPALIALGKQLRNLEQACRKVQDVEVKEWKANEKPVLEQEIASMEKTCASLMAQIEREAGQGMDHINNLENKLKEITDDMDVKKRKVHLPESYFTTGSGGVYCGLNDFWLQNMSGFFNITLQPNKDSPPEISIMLTGSGVNNQNNNNNNNNSSGGSKSGAGMHVQFRLEGFKLAGDRGKSVPKFQFENLKVAVSLSLKMTLSFDILKQKWLLPAKAFELKILSFKGPYGLNRSMVGAILSLVTPMIRGQIVANIPHELGILLYSLPAPFNLKGEFDIEGMDMGVLSQELHRCPVYQQLTGYNASQLEMFVLMQKCMDRSSSSVIKTLSDFVAYRRKFEKGTAIAAMNAANAANADDCTATGTTASTTTGPGSQQQQEFWTQIRMVWEEACELYCNHVLAAKMEQVVAAGAGKINPLGLHMDFHTFLVACDDVLSKRTRVKLRLHYLDGQLSINEFVRFLYQVQHRLASDALMKTPGGLKKIRLQTFLDTLQKQYDIIQGLFALVCQNFDFAHLTIVMSLHSGPQGNCEIRVSDLLAQAPVLINLSILEAKNIGSLPLVPYILSFKPQDNGDVCIELYHFNHDVHFSNSQPRNQTVSVAAPLKTATTRPIPPTATAVSSHSSSNNSNNNDKNNNISTSSAADAIMREAAGAIGVGVENSEHNSDTGIGLETGTGTGREREISMDSNMVGRYSTNYNRLLNTITQNRAAGNFRNTTARGDAFARDLYADGGDRSPQLSHHSSYQDLEPTATSNHVNNSNRVPTDRFSPVPGGGNFALPAVAEDRSTNGGGEAPVLASAATATTGTGTILRRTTSQSSSSQRSASPTTPTLNSYSSATGSHYKTQSTSPLLHHVPRNVRNSHLMVRHSALLQQLAHTLQDYPQGEESDTIVSVIASNPHISVIVDQAVKLQAGTELFTVIVGPKTKTWKPLGKSTLLQPEGGQAAVGEGAAFGAFGGSSGRTTFLMNANKNITTSSSKSSGENNNSNTGNNNGSSTGSTTNTGGGVPIRVQTAPGIKMLTQVARANVELNLPGLIRFLLAHFRDVPLLKEYLEIFIGGIFITEHLSIIKVLLETISKYLLLPGIDLDVNINIRVVVHQGEIIVRAETPDDGHQDYNNLSMDNLARLNNSNSNNNNNNQNNIDINRRAVGSSAVHLNAEISIRDIIDDVAAIMEQLTGFLDPVPVGGTAVPIVTGGGGGGTIGTG